MALITERERKFKDALDNPELFATPLLAILIDEYSTDFFDWAPEALYMEIKDDFHVKVSESNRNKIGALITAMTTNQFFQNADIFAGVCKSLSGSEMDFSVFRPVTPEELAWGVTEVLLNNPPDPERGNTEFSEEVASFVGMMLENQGVLQTPAALQFAIYKTPNPVEDLELMFADDETMFSAAVQNQKLVAQEIDQNTRENIQQLKAQLDSLPLSKPKEEGARS